MKISEIFDIRYGQKEYHNKENLEVGDTLLVSSQDTDNGCYGFFDIIPKFKPPIITVPSTGSIGCACVQLTECSSSDDALILKPKKRLTKEYLFYIAAAIRLMKWRFNYARKITPPKLGELEVLSDSEFKTSVSYEQLRKDTYPKMNEYTPLSLKEPALKAYNITELFDLERGHFHAIDQLESGDCLTVSRVSQDNGVVGFYKKPKKAKSYSPCLITVSTVTGDAFIQYTPFIATDNVVICKPKKQYKITTLIYIQASINKVKWRYSYGRQCYKRIFQKTVIFLPITKENEIDEEYIGGLVKNQPYWRAFKEKSLKTVEI